MHWRNIWNWINTFIATNTFSENMAHVLGGYGAVLTVAFYSFLGYGIVPWHWYLGLVVLAALKEYAYDAAFETPHQTFKMNSIDFLGYVVGIGLGLLVTQL
jgi:hypothetical protein